MSNSLIDLSALSHYKLLEDAYNASTFAAKGDIPTVNDATLTITQNGTQVATFSANAASNVSAAITVPTAVSDLTNDSGYQTASDVSSAIASAISGITGIQFEVVQSLPQTGDAGTIYLVPNGGSGTNTYDEYVWIVNSGVGSWEKIGSTTGSFTDVAYYDSVNNQLTANSSAFWMIATNADIAALFA